MDLITQTLPHRALNRHAARPAKAVGGIVEAGILPESSLLSRRHVLQLMGMAAISLLAKPLRALSLDRRLALHAVYTDEYLERFYWRLGQGYLESALSEFSWLLRDWRAGVVKPIDPRLLDILYTLQARFERPQPIQITSGYRTRQTNVDVGGAKNSFHCHGMAADIRIPAVSTQVLYEAALALKAGGVGYYPRGSFVHVDTGPVRHWQG